MPNRVALSLALLCCLAQTGATKARAALVPPPGWTARKLTDNLQFPRSAIVVDPITQDVFVGDLAATPTIWRVTSAGVRTVFLQGSELGLGLDGFALDPTAHEILVPTASTVRRYDLSGAFLGEETVTVIRLTLGLDGEIYASGATAPSSILRRDRATGTWSTWRQLAGTYSNVLEYCLAVDAAGRPFISTSQGLVRADAGSTMGLAISLLTPQLLGVSANASRIYWGDFIEDPEVGDGGNRVAFATSNDGTDGFIYGVGQDAAGNVYMDPIGHGAGQGALWQFTPGPTPARRTTWGLLKALYR